MADEYDEDPDFDEAEIGCRQTLLVSGDATQLQAFRRDLEETERWGSELDYFLRFGDFDPVPDHLFGDSARTMGRLCAYLRERWGDYADSSHPVGILAEAETSVTYDFFTSRTPLLGLARMLSAEFVKLRFLLEYRYPDGSGYDGKVTYEKGEMIDGLEETYEYMSHSDFEEFAGFDSPSHEFLVVCQSRGGSQSTIADLKSGKWDLSFSVETALKWGQAAVSFFVLHQESYTCDPDAYKGMDSFVITVNFERSELGEAAKPIVVGLVDKAASQRMPEFLGAIQGTEHQARRIVLANGGFLMELARCDRLADPYWHIDQLKLRCFRDATKKVVAIVFDSAADAVNRGNQPSPPRMKGGKVYLFPESKTRH